MPKASRGRRPAPRPKKKGRQAGSLPAGVEAAGMMGRSPPRALTPPAYGVVPLPESTAGRLTPSLEASRSQSREELLAGARRRPAGPTAARRRFIDSIGDYWYVGEDLRRIGLLSGILVGILIGLSFVVR